MLETAADSSCFLQSRKTSNPPKLGLGKKWKGINRSGTSSSNGVSKSRKKDFSPRVDISIRNLINLDFSTTLESLTKPRIGKNSTIRKNSRTGGGFPYKKHYLTKTSGLKIMKKGTSSDSRKEFDSHC